MALWMNRGGKYGEYEQRFLDDKRIYCTWDDLTHDLSSVRDRAALKKILKKTYPDAPQGAINQNASQIWAFAKRMAPGDWVALPSKKKPVIHFAEIKSPYGYDSSADAPFWHFHEVVWFATDIPRSSFPQDLLYSLGAFLTICGISRNNAEERIKRMAATSWQSGSGILPTGTGDTDEIQEQVRDLEQLGQDSIASLVIQKFKGHKMAKLVEAILNAQGFKTYLSPEGPDNGIDILAASGPLGFDTPRICVQVKSTQEPVERTILDQLIGSMQKVQATHGLLVSWGGFKNSYVPEERTQFFNVRLWDQNMLVKELLRNYDKLDEEIRSEIPLKRIWTVAMGDEE